MLRECQEAVSVSKRRRHVAIIRRIDFDSWFEDVNVTGTETGVDTATETITDLLKFGLVFSRRVALMSLILVAVGTYRRSFFSMILWSHNNYFLSRRMRYQYEFIVVNGQTTTSTFHNLV